MLTSSNRLNDAVRRRMPRWLRSRCARWVAIYVFLLIASHIFMFFLAGASTRSVRDSERFERIFVDVPAMNDDGPVGDRTFEISALVWKAAEPREAPPIVLLHGSPSGGGGKDFERLAPLLAEAGYTVYALDNPGFGKSSRFAPSYSVLSLARTTLAFLDASGIDRAHVVGWSLSGGTILHMADLAPERLASVTMLAAIGDQRAEGSGDYYFEHAKYGAGYGLIVWLPELIPHFGLLGGHSTRNAFIRNFWDTDQRALRGIMQRMKTPTLILHGRRDFLVPSWGAELHHELIESSRLVMLDRTHFMPFWTPGETAEHLIGFTRRHDSPGVSALIGESDFAPVDPSRKRSLGPFEFVRGRHWAWLIVIIILATFVSEDATVIAVGILIAGGDVDWGVGFLGCFLGIAAGDGGLWAIGRFAGRPALHWPFLRKWLPERAVAHWGRVFDRHAIKAVFLARMIPGTRLPTYLAAGILSKQAHRFLLCAGLAALIWTPMLLILAALVGRPLLDYFHGVFGGPFALVFALAALWLGVRIVQMCATAEGRVRLRVAVIKPWHVEFWPSWFFYLPLGPYVAWLSVRHGGLMMFSCVNPGVPHGGGTVGESKLQILEGLVRGGSSDGILFATLIEPGRGSVERAEILDKLVRTHPEFDGYPVILKPDESQRGHGLKLVMSQQEAENYFEDMTRPAMAQVYHAGPDEVGILWARWPGRTLDEPGHIFSVTRKVFPEVVGDGVSTLAELIWRHRRYRMQADVFLRRFVDRIDEIPQAGERIRLAVAGNHCQGTMFLDGADLITPELEKRIDTIARSFINDGFDFGRFDVRYASEDELRRGENIAILELNGTMSESTNLYDPKRSVFWSYGVLFRQWKLLFELGEQRRRSGVKPMRFRELLEAVREHYQGRAGSKVSD